MACFAVKPNPQPFHGDLVKPSDTGGIIDISWRPMWMDTGEGKPRYTKPIGYKAERLTTLWGKSWLNNEAETT